MFRKIIQPFYTAYVAVTFCLSVLVGFPFFLLVGARNTFAGRKIIFTIIRYWSRAWLFLIGMPVKTLGKRPAQGRYVVLANHISYIDTVVIFAVIPGYFRALGKKEISGIPFLGFIYKQLAITVNRSNHQSRSTSMRLMWRVLKHEGSILVFPEGTFNETGRPLKDFYDGAFRLAINTQTAIFPIIFPDTVRRWHYSAWWKMWPGRNRAVYLQPVEVAGLSINDLPDLKVRVYELMENELIKFQTGVNIAGKQGK